MRGEMKPSRVTVIKTMKTKPCEELRAKMSPKARTAADKMTKKFLAEIARQDEPGEIEDLKIARARHNNPKDKYISIKEVKKRL